MRTCPHLTIGSEPTCLELLLNPVNSSSKASGIFFNPGSRLNLVGNHFFDEYVQTGARRYCAPCRVLTAMVDYRRQNKAMGSKRSKPHPSNTPAAPQSLKQWEGRYHCPRLLYSIKTWKSLYFADLKLVSRVIPPRKKSLFLLSAWKPCIFAILFSFDMLFFHPTLS